MKCEQYDPVERWWTCCHGFITAGVQGAQECEECDRGRHEDDDKE